MSWEEVFEEEFCLSQEQLESVEEADQVRTPSESENEEPRLKAWWARMLKQALQDTGHEWPRINKGLTVVSGCTGCSAEAATMKARARV